VTFAADRRVRGEAEPSTTRSVRLGGTAVGSRAGGPVSAARPRIDREQAVAYRLRVNHLLDRLPAGSYCEATRVGLQDTAPRDALLGLHARIDGCGPDDWA